MSAAHDSPNARDYDEDAILVERTLSGDQASFQTLFRRYHDKVFAIARGVLLDSEEAADAVQEIFTLVYRNLRRFDRRAKFSTWLFRIAVNRSIQQARKIKKLRHNVPLSDFEEAPFHEDGVPATDPNIEVAMSRLNPTDRALLTLVYWDELSLQEVGESLGCSANAAKTRLFRSRERFRAVYEEVSNR